MYPQSYGGPTHTRVKFEGQPTKGEGIHSEQFWFSISHITNQTLNLAVGTTPIGVQFGDI